MSFLCPKLMTTESTPSQTQSVTRIFLYLNCVQIHLQIKHTAALNTLQSYTVLTRTKLRTIFLGYALNEL